MTAFQMPHQAQPPHFPRQFSQILAVQLQQIESVEKCVRSLASGKLGAQRVEVSNASLVTDDTLAIDNRALSR